MTIEEILQVAKILHHLEDSPDGWDFAVSLTSLEEYGLSNAIIAALDALGREEIVADGWIIRLVPNSEIGQELRVIAPDSRQSEFSFVTA